MRTKTLGLTAALIAAGAVSAMAQSNVYSLNVVGYINLTVPTGFSLVSAPLQSADATSSINSVLTNQTPALAFGSTVITWNPTLQNFNQAYFAGGDGNWYDQNYSYLLTNAVPPGLGFFINNIGSPVTITLTGTVLTGASTNVVTPGLNFYGQAVPIVGDLTTNGFPVVDGSFLSYYVNGSGYGQAVNGLGTNDSSYDGSGNIVGNPASNPVFTDQNYQFRVIVAPALGQGFVYTYAGPTAANWTQNFIVQ